MVSRVRIVFLALLIGLLLPLPGQSQSTLAVIDSEEFTGEGPGDNMVFSVQRNARYVTALAFNTGEAVTHRLERDGNIGEEVGRTYIGAEPRAMAMARNRDFTVVVNSIANELVVLAIGDDGQLREVSRAPSGGLNPYDVAVGHNDIVSVVNRDSDQINTFHIDRRGRLTPLAQAAAGIDPHVVAVSRNGFIGVANQGDRSVSLFDMNRRGELIPLGPPIAMSIAGSNPPANMVPRTLTWRDRDLFVALDAPGINEDLIRAFHLTMDGRLIYVGDAPAGAFLTDIDVTQDALFAVTANRNNLADPTDDRDEIRAYRIGEGTVLTLDASVQTPGWPPSFKQVSAWPGARGTWHVIDSEFQGGWLRSLLYTPDEP